MNTKTILPISEVRKNIFDITKKVQRSNTYYTITDKGRPKAVLMSAEEFESMQETIEVIRDFPNLDEDIKEAREEYKKGNYVTLDDLFKKEGYTKNNKTKK